MISVSGDIVQSLCLKVLSPIILDPNISKQVLLEDCLILFYKKKYIFFKKPNFCLPPSFIILYVPSETEMSKLNARNLVTQTGQYMDVTSPKKM